jgi:tRNA-specific 2-thiouridylase
VNSATGVELHTAADPTKDQSYVLYHLDRPRLERLLFPLGDMAKTEVREHAREFGLPVATKPDSQEICFVPRGRTAEYLAERLPVVDGVVVDRAGRELGRHAGAALYTVGQRTRLFDLREAGPWYVLRVDAAENRLVVGRREEVVASTVELQDATFIDGAEPPRLECEVRLRYRGPALRAIYDAGTLRLSEPAPRPAPGQAAVLYGGTRVIGGGTIRAAA